jgi:hypothetical protein
MSSEREALVDRLWSSSDRALRPGAFLLCVPFVGAAIVGLGSASVHLSAPGTSFAAWWPAAGVGASFLLVTPRRLRWVALPVIALATFLANDFAGRPWDLALWYGVANVAEAAVVVAVLTDRFRRPAALDTLEDAGRLLAAAFLGAATLGLLAGAGIGLLADGEFWIAARSLTASHMAADIIILPIVLVGPGLVLGQRAAETLLQSVTALAVTAAVFGVNDGLPLAFVPLPFLMWGAMRLTPQLMSLELFAVGVGTALLTTRGHGPFAANDLVAAYGPYTVALLLQLALLSYTIVVLPLTIAAHQRRVAIRSAEDARDFLNGVLDAAHSLGVVALNQKGTIVYLSAGAQAMMGYSAAEVVGKMSPTDFYAEPSEAAPDNPRSITEVLASIQSEDTFARDILYRRKDGSTFVGHVRISRRTDAAGGQLGYMAVIEDVSEARRSERALRDALDREHEAVQRMAALDKTKNEFIASVSHELRTPITSVIGYTELLLARDPSPDQSRLLDPIHRNAGRLLVLIEDLLTVSKMDGGTFFYRPAPMDLCDVMRSAVEAMEWQLKDRDLELVRNCVSERVLMVGDENQLERAVTNLLTNATKFTPDGGKISVSLRIEGAEAIITVADTGIGIPESEHGKVFERFFRSASSQNLAIEGTGLGLHIVSQIVAAHHGTVDFESAEGVGTTFVIRLPMKR